MRKLLISLFFLTSNFAIAGSQTVVNRSLLKNFENLHNPVIEIVETDFEIYSDLAIESNIIDRKRNKQFHLLVAPIDKEAVLNMLCEGRIVLESDAGLVGGNKNSLFPVTDLNFNVKIVFGQVKNFFAITTVRCENKVSEIKSKLTVIKN